MSVGAGWLETAERDGTLVVKAAGQWDVGSVGSLDSRLRLIRPETGHPVRIDIGGIEALDTAGAWVLYRTIRELRAAGRA